MDNVDASRVEHHLEKTKAVRRDVTDLLWDVDSVLSDTLINKMKALPSIQIRKGDLGRGDAGLSLNPDETIEMKPTALDDDGRPIIALNLERFGSEKKSTPLIKEEVVTSSEIRQFEDSLPRTYRGIDDKDERAWVFRDERGDPVGWVVVHENGKSAHIGFIGVAVKFEGSGYGKSIIDFLQRKYESLSLNMVAYDTAGRGYDKARDRLLRFYLKNGFYIASGGMYWGKNEPNLETGMGSLMVKDIVIAQGTRYSAKKLLEVYLTSLKRTDYFDKVFSDGERDMFESWLNLRKELRLLDQEGDKYSQLLDDHERSMASHGLDMTESVGV